MKGINDKNIWSLYISNTYIHTLKKQLLTLIFPLLTKFSKDYKRFVLKLQFPCKRRHQGTSLWKPVEWFTSVKLEPQPLLKDINMEEKVEQATNSKNISLPISRVRLIMKSSPDVSCINQDALFLTTKATVIWCY